MTTKEIHLMMVDDEPLIRKIVLHELSQRVATIESGNIAFSEDYHVVIDGAFADEDELMAALDEGAMPDYILVDMEFSGRPSGGISITRHIKRRLPESKVIIFSGRFDNPTHELSNRQRRIHDIGDIVMTALQAGANAFVSKNAIGGFAVENVLRAIACLQRGEKYYFNYPVMLTLKEAAESYLLSTAAHNHDITLTDKEQTLLLLEASGATASDIASRLDETEKAIQERQKELSRRLDIVNKSGARVAKAIYLGLLDPSQVPFLPRS